jgi:hypothetical protein
MLLFLVYAPFLAISQKSKSRLTIALCVVVWIGILVASYRSGGDLWDNPRYRATFAGLQASLAAWAWMEHKRLADPWLRRALLAAAAVLAWFLPWYLLRYYSFYWPVADFFKTLGLGFFSACLLILWDWARTR